jgi:hypothetical protein
MPGDLLAKVLEELEAAEQMAPQRRRRRGSEASATMRLVCSGWKYHHDTMVMWVMARRLQAADEVVINAGATVHGVAGAQECKSPQAH